MAAGFRVRIDVRVKSDPLTRRNYKVKSFDGGVRVENQGLTNDSGYFPRSLAFWASDDQPRRYAAY